MTQKTLICIRWYTFLVIFGYVSAQDSDNCPRKPDMIGEGRTCKKACTTNASCSENRECLCDDVCGFSCVNPTAICFQLESLENGQITVPENPVFGNEAIYTCNAGYRFSQPGESIRLCQGDREWSGTAPMCVIDVSCGPPPDVVNSLHDGEKDSYNVGDRVIYNCNSGYYRRGLAIIQCRSNGIWSNTAFECVARSCGSPGSIRNGRTIGNLFTFPNRVYYECNEGYNLIGRSYQACQTNMEWSGYQPECRPVSCPRLLPPDDGTMIGSTFTYDEVVIFRCNIGYKLHGSSQQRCQANGEWTGEHVSCRVINCGPPEPIYNGNRDRNFFGLDSVIFFECNDNYLLEGSRSTRCLENETWSTPTPKCWAQCVVNNPPRNTYITNRNVRIGYRVNHGTHLNYECTDENRYVLNHTQDAECFNGSWNMIPTCVAKPCQPLSDSDPHVSIQQEIIDGKVPHNKYAVYSCSRGYRLENEYQRRCQFGTWSRNTPSCIAKLCPRDGVIVNGNIKYLINNHEYSNPIHSRLVQDTQRLYECDNGYTLSNYDVRVPDLCDNEEWRLSDNMPYCSPDPCSRVPNFEYLYRNNIDYSDETSRWSYRHGSTATVTCSDNNRMLLHGGIFTCTAGTWLPDEDLCVEASCTLPLSLPAHVVYLQGHAGQEIQSGHSFRLTCESENYNLEGSGTVYCQNGELDEIPVCSAAPCYAIPYSPYLQVEYSQQFDPFPHESWAELSCSSDSYEVQGEKRTQCLFGDWTYPQPTCIAASCSIADSELPAHSTVNTNEIAHGSSINYGCEEGYQIQDSANEDFINILCHYGLWSRTLPVCVEAKCTLLIGVTYDYSVIRGWEVAPGIDVTFTCDQGFQQSPSNGTVRCQKGEWRPHIPQCVQEGCELPTDIVPPLKLENPPIESIVQHGTSITYGCYDGFWLSDDNNEHECYQGVWSIHTSGGLFIPAERPTCIQSNTDISNGCSCPADRVNIVIFYEHKVVDNCNGRTFPHRAEITQRCSDIESFDFYGDTKRTCNSGQWSGEAARCEVAPFLFRISGHATRVIAEDGRLFVHASGEEFYIDCQKPSSVARNADWYRFDELRGSYFVGKRQWRRIRFYSDRTYQSGTYKCRRLLQGSQESYDERFIKVYIHDTTCPNPGVPENGQQIVDPGMDVGISRTFILNDQVLFRCNDGYKLIGSGSITCTYRRAWTGPTPTCVPNVCSSIEVPHNGNKVHTTSVNGEVGYIIGDKVQFSCNPGFDLVGENEITCEEDLQWSHDVPTCRASRLLCGDEVCSEDEVCIDNQCRCLPPAYCSNERQLVCGSDGNTYGNMCRLNATRCFYGTDIEKVSDGMCPDYSCETHDCNNDEECFINENDEPDCRCKDYCDDDFDPVCATDGILYDNRCKFRVHRCRTDEDIAIDDTGSSCEPEQEDVDDSCTRSCSPDTVSVACQRVVDQECFVLIGILDTKYEDNSQTFYEINVTQAVGHQKPPVNGSPVYLYGPSRKDDGCLCPPIEEINNMYVIFGSKDNFRFIVENYNFAAILDEDMSEQLKRECAIYFSSN